MIRKAEDLILNKDQLVRFRKRCKEDSKKVVLASGVFDVLHEGHLRFLQKVSEIGDALIVGINNDIYARKKGVNRPIHDENVRAFLIAGFECVSCVHIFDNTNPQKSLLNLVQPDILIMSSSSMDKPEDRSHHFELMKKIGGEVLIFDEFSMSHSTSIIEKIMFEI